MTGNRSLHASEDGRTAQRFVFHRKGMMKVNEATLPIHTVDVSEQGMGIMMDKPIRIGFPCMLFFHTVVGERIVPLNFTGIVIFPVAIDGCRFGRTIRMVPANHECKQTFGTAFFQRLL